MPHNLILLWCPTCDSSDTSLDLEFMCVRCDSCRASFSPKDGSPRPCQWIDGPQLELARWIIYLIMRDTDAT